MSRNHIHFAVGLPGDRAVISGMRRSAQLYIFLDVPKAMAAGIEFFRSSNNVVLSSGLNGFIPPTLFLKVVDSRGEPFADDLAITTAASAPQAQEGQQAPGQKKPRRGKYTPAN
eukprot:c11456_g1_i3.p2 GENE.c11456_g1_i3~~c11456_g1_i3.p2  ORF type:complete len:114 (+),score=16.53 c11456_g1_i3:446-787(+)